MPRKWLPTLSELIDRLSIHQLKEVFIPAAKEQYAAEMTDIRHDIDILLQENKTELTAELIHTIVLLSQINAHIWYNESKARNGEDQNLNLLKLTHGLNGIRNRLMNKILDILGKSDKRDYKVDCLAAEFSDWQVDLLYKEQK